MRVNYNIEKNERRLIFVMIFFVICVFTGCNKVENQQVEESISIHEPMTTEENPVEADEEAGVGIFIEENIPFGNFSRYKMSFKKGLEDGYYNDDLPLDESAINCYEGLLKIYVDKDGELTENPYTVDDVVIPGDYRLEFMEAEGGMAFYVPIRVGNEIMDRQYIVDKEGKISIAPDDDDSDEQVEAVTGETGDISVDLGPIVYRIKGNTIEEKYEIVDHAGNVILDIPDDMTGMFDTDKDSLGIGYSNMMDGNFLLSVGGEVFVYEESKDKWHHIKIDGQDVSGEFERSDIIEIHGKYSGKRLLYFLEDESLEEVVRVGYQYMDKGIHWDGQVYYNYSYQVGEDMEPIRFLDSDELVVNYGGLDYVISDSFNYMGSVYVLDGQKEKLSNLESGLALIEGSIGSYAYSDGILAYEDLEASAWYYYDFESGENIKFSDEMLPIVMTHDREIGYIDSRGHISIYSVNEKSVVDKLDVLEEIEGEFRDELLMDFDENHIYVNVGVCYVVDRNTHNTTDSFPIREVHVAENGRIFYTVLGCLFEYNPDRKTHYPLGINDYCVYLTSMDDNLIVYQGVDGPGNYAVYDMDESWFESSEAAGVVGYDYILFYQGTEFGSQLYVYDRIHEQLDFLESSGGMIDYGWEEAEGRIMYQRLERGMYGEEQLPDKEVSDYPIPEDASLYIYDFAIQYYRNKFNDDVLKGYVLPGEFYELDYGQFMVFTSPYYNDGKYDEKGINIYIKGAHQKNYPIWNDSLRMPLEAEVKVFKVNEDRDMLYIVYELEGEKYGVVISPTTYMLRFSVVKEIKFGDYESEEAAIEYLDSKL